MKFPYGISDFYDIITEKYYYIDRTDRIPLIENAGKHLLFLRPRRFGKSLLLSMLKNYYDIAKADEFEQLFGNLTINKKPTVLHNKYFVLEWDFSSVNPMGAAPEIQSRLYHYINGTIKDFALYYKHLLPIEIEIYPDDAQASFQSLLLAVRQTPHKLYLLIDEYDNFANELMMSRDVSKERYKSLVYGEGCLKALFKVIKSATKGYGLARAFITGVSPVVMSDMTSGHNIAENIDLHPKFNDLCGFTETEIAAVLKQIVRYCGFPDDEAAKALEMMKRYYNGYRFTYGNAAYSYNPTMAIYFMKYLQETGEYPKEMLDDNMAMDRGKLAYIAGLPGGGKVIQKAVDSEKPLTVSVLARRFGVEDMLYADKDNTFMASLLYFFGILTFGGVTTIGTHILQVPNQAVRGLFLERLRTMLLPDTKRNDMVRVAETFYNTGALKPVCAFIEQNCFKAFDNRDYRWANELTVKTAFLSLLFNDTLYITDSETALERNYADMTLIVRPDKRQFQLLDFLFEFKYVSLKDNNLSGDKVRVMTDAELKTLTPVKHKFAEAEAKLKGYRQTLEAVYDDKLRLRCYSVVSIGFDRLVQVEI